MRIYGFSLFERQSNNQFCIISYHPRMCWTWHWYISIGKIYQPMGVDKWFGWCRSVTRTCQWHDFYFLFKRWQITVGFQDYHKNPNMWRIKK